MRLTPSLCVVVLGSVIGGTAFADPSEADKVEAARLAREGEQHGNKNELRDALLKFKQAARLDPSTPAYLCNVGLAYYGLNEPSRAHLNLTRCHDATGKWPPGVQEVYAFIEGELARRDYMEVTITGVPEGAKIAIGDLADEGDLFAPLRVFLPAGNYVYEVSAPGYARYKGEVRDVGRKAVSERYRLDPVEAAGPAVVTGDGATVGEGTDFTTSGDGITRRSPDRGPDVKRIAGWATIGAGGLAGLIGGGFYLGALKTHGTLKDGVAEPRYTTLKDRMLLRQNVAVAFGIGGAALAAAGVYLVLSSGDDERATLSAAPTTEGGMVWLSWSR